MHVDWAIPCRFVEAQPPFGATIVGAGADVVRVPQLPAPIQVLFAVRYVSTVEEADGETEHAAICRVFTPDGERAGEMRATFVVHGELQVAGYLVEMIVPQAVIIDAREFGSYRIEFAIDDGDPLGVPVHILEVPTS